MPKDPTRNQPNYKIGGYHINEHEYETNKGQITKEEDQYPRPKPNTEDPMQQDAGGNAEPNDEDSDGNEGNSQSPANS